MHNDESHINDSELIQALDGEASSRRASEIDAHLAACWQCRSRRAHLERTIDGFVRVHQAEARELPPLEIARAELRAKLSEADDLSPRTFAFRGRLAYGSFAIAAALALAVTLYFNVQKVGAASTPNARLTPGATRMMTREEVCSAAGAEGFYPIPATLAYRVFEKYRIQNPGPRSYEVDYLITPALGGADDIRNLWPQPYASGVWNAHVKDALEDYLHDQVCSGELDLQTAQQDISRNWIAAYRKYFKTERPLEKHAAFSVDPPWED